MKTLKEQLAEKVEEINYELNMAEHYYEELYCSNDMYAARCFSDEMEDILKEIEDDDDSSTPLEYLLPLYNIDLHEIIIYKRIMIYMWKELIAEGYSVEAADYIKTYKKLSKKYQEQEDGTASAFGNELYYSYCD